MATSLLRHYRTLGLSNQARLDEIKKAFRELALRYHPDRNPDDPAATAHFRTILDAYESLLDHFRKRDGRHRGSARAESHAGGSWASAADNSKDPQDIFAEYFGFDLSHRRSAAVRRNDLRFDLQLSRQAMIEGGYEWIDYQRMVFCQECYGRNGVRGPTSTLCPRCHGQGEVEENRTVEVWIPPGSQHGTRLRIPCGGDQPQPDYPAGDLVILLHLGT